MLGEKQIKEGDFRIVVSVGGSLEKDLELSEICGAHTPTIHFVRTNVTGLFGGVFVDLGQDFLVQDVDGEVIEALSPP